MIDFNTYAKEWWDKDGSMKALHALNKTRLSYILGNINVKNKKILDIGCGGGILSESLAEKGAIVTGIDESSELILAAKAHSNSKNLSINYRHINAAQFQKTTEDKYDVIMLMEVIEHVNNPQELILICSKLLASGGSIFISTLNKTFKAYTLGILAAEYLFNIVPKGTHQYDKFLKPSQIESYLRKSELKLADIKGVGYNPFNNESYLTTDLSVNYILKATWA